MTLENLLRTGQLKSHAADAREVNKLLEAARHNIEDAHSKSISAETRFDAAYKAIMQGAMVALMANGFRPDTNRTGHHVTVLRSLPKTIGFPNGRLVVLDVLRRKRNLSDYMGDSIDDGSVKECINEAVELLKSVEVWLKKNRPDLLR